MDDSPRPQGDGYALLIIDMISTWAFEDATALLEQAAPVAPRIQALKARCKAAGVPVIYANDNHGRWRSDFRQVVADALACGHAGAAIARQLAPDQDDYFILKPRQSAFFSTPLDLLLQHLKLRHLLLTGVAGDQCVLTTAADARLRDYEVSVPGDCIASQSGERHARSLRHLEDAMRVAVRPSAELDLAPR